MREIATFEGATIVLEHVRSPDGREITRLRAFNGNKEVRMTVDKVADHNMKRYLELTVREIARCRQRIFKKPEWRHTPIYTIERFTIQMAALGMFKFDDFNGATKNL